MKLPSAPLLLSLATSWLQPRSCEALYQVFYIYSDNAANGDASIFLNEPDQAAGGANLVVGCNAMEDCARSLFKFDVSSMPSDAEVTDAQLVLVPRNAGAEGEDPEVVPIDVHRLSSDWTRTTLSTLDGEMSGVVASDGDVTWKYSSYPSTEWTSAGGDVDDTVLSTVAHTAGDSNAVFFESTDAFASVVQGWISGSTPNYGVLVKRSTEDASETGFREFFNEQSGNKPRRSPKLLVQYNSISEPDQKASEPSGPGIVLPGEPTPAPVTSSPTSAFTCPVDAASTLVHFETTDQHATLLEDEGDISVDRGSFAVGISRNGARRALLRFPLDNIPEGSIITCAEVVLSPTGPCSPCQHTTDIHMYGVSNDWSSTGTNTWLEQTEQGVHDEVELLGALANTGDTTWAYRNYNSANPSQGTAWSQPGGDFDDVVISSEVDGSRQMHKFPNTEEFLALIQSIVDGERENYGFILMTDESDEHRAKVAEENTYKDHDSAYKVFYGNNAEDEADRPVLIIHYEAGPVEESSPNKEPEPAPISPVATSDGSEDVATESSNDADPELSSDHTPESLDASTKSGAVSSKEGRIGMSIILFATICMLG